MEVMFQEMTDSPIVFLDSGIGGLPYLQWLCCKRPLWPVVYAADTEFFPYGELDSVQLNKVVCEVGEKIFRELKPALLVLACNSASVTALASLRLIAPCPVVGTVPAVKQAATLPGKGPIGILATEATIDSIYLKNLLRDYAGGKKVIKVAAGDVVRFVENELMEISNPDSGARNILEKSLYTFIRAKVDSVVLGCTHFLHICGLIQEILGENIVLVDSRDGVGCRIIDLCEGMKIREARRNDFFVTRIKGDIRITVQAIC